MTYDPTEVDLLWMANIISMTKEGATIIFPSSGLVYKVSHLKRTLTLQNTSKLADPECKKLHEMTTVVAGFFMYETKEATQ